MDSNRFDALSRSVGAARSRRGLMQLLAGLALGVPLAVRGSSDLAAAKKRRGKKRKKRGGQNSPTCPAGYTACGEQCFDLRDNVQHCGACAVVCSPGKVCCNGVCANLQDDDNNCSACGQRCRTRDEETPREDAAEICQNGTCVDCKTSGFIDPDDPRICCRGLTLCPGNDSGTIPSRCIPANQTC